MSAPPSSVAITAINQAAIIMDVSTLACNKDDATLFQIIDEVQFYEYPSCGGIGYSNFNVLPGDTVIAKWQFYLKKGTYTNPIIMRNHVGLGAVQRQVGVPGEQVILDKISINTAQFEPNCDNIQEIEFYDDRGYILPVGDCRNKIGLFRMPTLDIAGFAAYEGTFPFKIRWEEWRQLDSGEGQRCFPTPTQDWKVYANTPGWTPSFVITAEVYDASTGHTTNFEHITWGTIKDPCDLPYATEFNTFDVTGVNSYEEVIMKDVNTKVVATITGDFSGFVESQLYGILTLDAWGVGGVNYALELGSRIPTDGIESAWYGAGSTFVAALTKVSNNTVTLTGFLDYRYLPKDTDLFIPIH